MKAPRLQWDETGFATTCGQYAIDGSSGYYYISMAPPAAQQLLLSGDFGARPTPAQARKQVQRLASAAGADQ